MEERLCTSAVIRILLTDCIYKKYGGNQILSLEETLEASEMSDGVKDIVRTVENIEKNYAELKSVLRSKGGRYRLYLV